MTEPRIEITPDEIFALVMSTAQVQSKVQGRAAKIAARVRRELHRAGIDASVSIRQHGLPTGRSSYDVVVQPADPADERRCGAIARRAQREVRR